MDRTKEQNDPNPIGDENPSKPSPLQARVARPQTLPEVKKRSGITMKGDYFDTPEGRA